MFCCSEQSKKVKPSSNVYLTHDLATVKVKIKMTKVLDSYLQSWFAIYCSLLFGDRLSRDLIVQFEDLSDTNVIGYFDPDFNTIGISDDIPENFVKSVLLHEMTHAWDYAIRGKTDHGETFQQKATEIEEKLGICI